MDKRHKKNGPSVASRIRRSSCNQLFFMMLCCNFIALLLAAAAWCYAAERNYTGQTQVHTLRTLVERRVERTTAADGSWKVDYVLRAPQLPEQRVDATEPLGTALALFGLAFAAELILLAVMDLINAARIRHQLRPIARIAEEAQRLSRSPLDATQAPFPGELRTETRTQWETARDGSATPHASAVSAESFHTLEDAIEQIQPDTPGQRLSTGQSELGGLEAAINDLIARMQASYQQQSRFVSDASHELRTPIAVVKGYADMLARWGRDDETVLNESIAAIQSETAHMGTLVEQLLFLARGDSGRTQLAFETVALSPMLSEVFEESCMIHPDHQWRFSADENLSVRADPAMLKQAVRILIDNAVKYTPAGETIRIRGYCGTHGEQCIEVQDSGIGISDSEAKHIFERFFRSDPARSSQTGGTGLGLSIAKWIIDRHGGWFDVLSHPDFGTRMTICLPAGA